MRKPENKNRKMTMNPRVRAAVTLFKKVLAENKPYIIEDLLLEAGYAPASAKQQTNVMQAIRPHVDDFVKRLERHQDQVLDQMEEKVAEAKYHELARGLDVTVKSARLLSGRSTHNIAVISEDRRKHLEQLLED